MTERCDHVYEGGVMLGLGVRFLIDAGHDDADILAAVSGVLSAARNPETLSTETRKNLGNAIGDLTDEVTQKTVREDPRDR